MFTTVYLLVYYFVTTCFAKICGFSGVSGAPAGNINLIKLEREILAETRWAAGPNGAVSFGHRLCPPPESQVIGTAGHAWDPFSLPQEVHKSACLLQKALKVRFSSDIRARTHTHTHTHSAH